MYCKNVFTLEDTDNIKYFIGCETEASFITYKCKKILPIHIYGSTSI